MTSIVCPLCNKDDTVQKLSAVFVGGTSLSSFSGPSSSHVSIDGKSGSAFGYTHLSGYGTTELARLFTPPAEPIKPSKSGWFVVLGSLSCTAFSSPFAFGAAYGIFFLLDSLLHFDMEGNGIGFWIAQFLFWGSALAGIALMLIAYARLLDRREEREFKERKLKYETEKPKWDTAIEKWDRLYYCHRDGIVFDPQSGETCKPTSLREFLYESAS